MDFAPLFSGSSGNATYVRIQDTRLLVDAGVSGARIAAELKKLDVAPDMLDALLVTHEHADHIAGIGVLSRRYHLPVYATQGTWEAMAGKVGAIDPANRRVIPAGQDFYLNQVEVTPFPIPHDAAEPVGYAFAAQGIKVAVATDLGHLSDSWMDPLEGCDLLLLESNHDVEMLKAGRYPYELKRRILGRKGHLSNEDAARAAQELAARGVKRILPPRHKADSPGPPEPGKQLSGVGLPHRGPVPGAGGDMGERPGSGPAGLPHRGVSLGQRGDMIWLNAITWTQIFRAGPAAPPWRRRRRCTFWPALGGWR